MEKALKYLKAHVGADIVQQPLSNPALAGLPNAVRYQYRFESWTLFGIINVAMMPLGNNNSPGELIRHAEIVQEKTGNPVVLVFDDLPAYVRQRLAAKGQSLVVAGRQIFLPRLMILTTRAPAKAVVPQYLSAPAQLFVLTHVQHGGLDNVTGNKLSLRFGGSAMTWSRALSELVALSLGEEIKLDKFRYFRFLFLPDKLWEKAVPFLRNPVKKTCWVKDLKPQFQIYEAGLTALAEYTALAEPHNRVIAVSRRLFIKYKADLHVVPWPEENSVSLQVWSYDPAKISSGKAVDPLSLYLSFLDETDERVIMAREQLLKGIAWFRG